MIAHGLLVGYLPTDEFRANPSLSHLDAFHWISISEAAKDFTVQLLRRNPEYRLSDSQILNHPWLASGEELKEHRLE